MSTIIQPGVTLDVTALAIAASIVADAKAEPGTPFDARQKARVIGHLAKLILEHMRPDAPNPPGIE